MSGCLSDGLRGLFQARHLHHVTVQAQAGDTQDGDFLHFFQSWGPSSEDRGVVAQPCPVLCWQSRDKGTRGCCATQWSSVWLPRTCPSACHAPGPCCPRE